MFLGRRPQEDVEGAFSRAACIATASEREGYGLIVVEAAARGTPSVVVDGLENAAVELVVDGVNGVVAPEASADSIGSAISTVVRRGAGSSFFHGCVVRGPRRVAPDRAIRRARRAYLRRRETVEDASSEPRDALQDPLEPRHRAGHAAERSGNDECGRPTDDAKAASTHLRFESATCEMVLVEAVAAHALLVEPDVRHCGCRARSPTTSRPGREARPRRSTHRRRSGTWWRTSMPNIIRACTSSLPLRDVALLEAHVGRRVDSPCVGDHGTVDVEPEEADLRVRSRNP